MASITASHSTALHSTASHSTPLPPPHCSAPCSTPHNANPLPPSPSPSPSPSPLTAPPLPQLIVLQRFGEVENLTSHYIALLGAYRGLYILNWIYDYYSYGIWHPWVVYICGVLQTALYCDFFHYFIEAKKKGGTKFSLPSAHAQ